MSPIPLFSDDIKKRENIWEPKEIVIKTPGMMNFATSGRTRSHKLHYLETSGFLEMAFMTTTLNRKSERIPRSSLRRASTEP